MPAENGDWLEGENPFQAFDDRKSGRTEKENEEAALRWAQLIQATFATGAGAQVLKHWTTVTRQRRVAPNASQGELAYHNGVREFIEGIHAQIEFAMRGGQLAYREQ